MRVVTVILVMLAAALCTLATPFAAATAPRVSLLSAPEISFPGAVDSNSPAVWDLVGGQRRIFVMTSHSGVPSIAQGTSVDRLSTPTPITITPHPGYGVWMEAVVSDDVNTWYGFYHNEWPALRCNRDDRFVPRIGMAKSTDAGRTWQDLGIILQARRTTSACASENKFVIGGVGDLSVMLDADKNFLYIFYSQYPEAPSSQGVAVARMLWAERDRPWGDLEIWRDGVWDPDTGRRVVGDALPGQSRGRFEWIYPFATPLVAPQFAWHDADNKVDAFWGPSVHWNSAIDQYVMLLNRAKDESYTQDGIYVSFAPRLDDPRLWTAPQKILNGGRWYPQVIGSAAVLGTDKLAATSPRLFIGGKSEWVINFSR